MKKYLAVFVLMLAAAAGCSRQQEPKGGPVPYPGVAPAVTSPEEIKMLEKAAQQSPKNVDAWIRLGNTLMDAGRFGDAVDAYGKALALDPKNLDVRVDRGTCLKNSGKPQEAAEEYRKVLQENPKHVYAHRNLAVVLAFDLHDSKAGAKEFEKYLELAPNAPDAPEIRKTVQQLKSGK